jgi:hypothetical protein
LLTYAEHRDGKTKSAFFCFEVWNPDRLLIGRVSRARSYDRSGMTEAVGKVLPIRYDDRKIWVMRPNGKTLTLRQDYETNAFPQDTPCERMLDAGIARRQHPQKALQHR